MQIIHSAGVELLKEIIENGKLKNGKIMEERINDELGIEIVNNWQMHLFLWAKLKESGNLIFII